MSTTVIEGARVEVPATPVGAFYAHGWHSWCRTGWFDPAIRWRPIPDRVDRLGHDDPLHAFDDRPGGSAMGAVDHGDGEVSLLGALDLDSWVQLDGDTLIGRRETGPGRWLVARGREDDVFAEYAHALADRFGRRGGDVVRLWCSWYSYYEDIDASKIGRVVDGLDDLPFDIIQIDDGWQRGIGDWTPNGRFPEGLKPLVDQIKTSGRRAGLWMAPFIAAPDSRLATERPEMLLRDDSGDPVVAGENWGAPYYALDVTHPTTMAHLRERFAAFCDLGFTFFKLDFIYAAAYPGKQYEPIGRESGFRRALEAIREAVGDEVYLLACGAPIVASIGVCDGIRIGPDIGPWWVAPDSDDPETGLGARNAVSTSVSRLWLQPAIDVDPDVAFFRSEGVVFDAVTKRRVQQLAHIAGFQGNSDPPDWLTNDEREALGAFLGHAPTVEKLARYAWRVADEHVDFAPAFQGSTPSWGAA